MNLFRRNGATCEPLSQWMAPLEADIQTLISSNLQPLLQMHWLANEYPAADKGRIDTIGIDALGGPIIIEFKRSKKDGVISQALSYLQWLEAHKIEYEHLVRQRLGHCLVDWSAVRLICIAADFSDYDLEAIQMVNANIDLVTYHLYADDLIGLAMAGSHRKRDYRRNMPRNTEDKPGFWRRLEASEVACGLMERIRSILANQELDFIVMEADAGLEIHGRDALVGRILMKGSGSRLVCHFNFMPDELQGIINEKWVPGLHGYRRIRHGFELPFYDQLSLDAFEAIIHAIHGRKILAEIWH